MAATITVVCSQCRNKMRASTEHVGRKGRCPSCGALVDVKASGHDSFSTAHPLSSTRGGAADPRRSGATEVNPWLAALYGAAGTVVLYSIFVPLYRMHYALGTFMVDRSKVQHAITLVTCWGLAMLVLKYLAVRRQMSDAELELELIPLDIGLQITSENVDQFIDHLAQLPADRREGILARRIRGALEHFKFRNSVPEVQGYLSTQASIDASGVDSGYTLLRAFIWVCPILGFIGTVYGISAGVMELNGIMEQMKRFAATDGQKVQDAMTAGMGEVTQGLATAFDTTMLGLVCVVMLLFPTELLRKMEYAMLDRIEEFANESLLRRMTDGPGMGGELPEVVRDALQAAFQQHQQWLAQWQDQVAQLGQAIGRDFEAAIGPIQERAAKVEATRLDQMLRTGKALDQILEKAGQTAAALQHTGLRTAEDLRDALDVARGLHQAVGENNQLLGQFLGRAGASPPTTQTHPMGITTAPEPAGLSSGPSTVHAPLLPIPSTNGRTGLFGRFRGR